MAQDNTLDANLGTPIYSPRTVIGNAINSATQYTIADKQKMWKDAGLPVESFDENMFERDQSGNPTIKRDAFLKENQRQMGLQDKGVTPEQDAGQQENYRQMGLQDQGITQEGQTPQETQGIDEGNAYTAQQEQVVPWFTKLTVGEAKPIVDAFKQLGFSSDGIDESLKSIDQKVASGDDTVDNVMQKLQQGITKEKIDQYNKNLDAMWQGDPVGKLGARILDLSQGKMEAQVPMPYDTQRNLTLQGLVRTAANMGATSTNDIATLGGIVSRTINGDTTASDIPRAGNTIISLGFNTLAPVLTLVFQGLVEPAYRDLMPQPVQDTVKGLLDDGAKWILTNPLVKEWYKPLPADAQQQYYELMQNAEMLAIGGAVGVGTKIFSRVAPTSVWDYPIQWEGEKPWVIPTVMNAVQNAVRPWMGQDISVGNVAKNIGTAVSDTAWAVKDAGSAVLGKIGDAYSETVTGLSKSEQKGLNANPQQLPEFEEMARQSDAWNIANIGEHVTDRVLGVADDIQNSINDLKKSHSDDGALYEEVKNLPTQIPAETIVSAVTDAAKEKWLAVQLDVDGKPTVYRPNGSSAPDISPTELGKINQLLSDIGADSDAGKGKLNPRQVIAFRSKASALSEYDSNSTKPFLPIAKAIRSGIDAQAKEKIPWLRELDEQYHDKYEEKKDAMRDLVYKQGDVKDDFRSNFGSIVKNLHQASRADLLGRLEDAFPELNIGDRIKAINNLPKLYKAYTALPSKMGSGIGTIAGTVAGTVAPWVGGIAGGLVGYGVGNVLWRAANALWRRSLRNTLSKETPERVAREQASSDRISERQAKDAKAKAGMDEAVRKVREEEQNVPTPTPEPQPESKQSTHEEVSAIQQAKKMSDTDLKKHTDEIRTRKSEARGIIKDVLEAQKMWVPISPEEMVAMREHYLRTVNGAETLDTALARAKNPNPSQTTLAETPTTPQKQPATTWNGGVGGNLSENSNAPSPESEKWYDSSLRRQDAIENPKKGKLESLSDLIKRSNNPVLKVLSDIESRNIDELGRKMDKYMRWNTNTGYDRELLKAYNAYRPVFDRHGKWYDTIELGIGEKKKKANFYGRATEHLGGIYGDTTPEMSTEDLFNEMYNTFSGKKAKLPPLIRKK